MADGIITRKGGGGVGVQFNTFTDTNEAVYDSLIGDATIANVVLNRMTIEGDFIYAANNAEKIIYKFNKDNLTLVGNSVALNVNIGRNFVVKGNTIFIPGQGPNLFNASQSRVFKMHKENLVVDIASANFNGSIPSLDVDDEFVYVVQSRANNPSVIKMNQSDLNIVQNTASGFTTIASMQYIRVKNNTIYYSSTSDGILTVGTSNILAAKVGVSNVGTPVSTIDFSDDYIYYSSSSGVFRRNLLSNLAVSENIVGFNAVELNYNSISVGGTSFSVRADGNFVYYGGGNTVNSPLVKVQANSTIFNLFLTAGRNNFGSITNLSYVKGNNYGGTIQEIVTDSEFVYVCGNTDGKIKKYRKNEIINDNQGIAVIETNEYIKKSLAYTIVEKE